MLEMKDVRRRPGNTPLLLRLLVALLIPALAAAGDPVPVTVRPAAELLFHPELSAPAEVVPLNDARLSAEISARIDAIPVRVGDEVAAGDLLVSLDCRDYRSRLEAQQASRQALESRRRLARTQLERARDLKRERNVSQEQVDQRETDLLALNAEISAQRHAEEQAALNVSRCEVHAPFRAVVTERLASRGSLAAPGTPLVHLVQLDQARVSAQLRPDEAAAGASAEGIEFTWQGGRYPLKLAKLLPVVEPRTRTRELRFDFVSDTAPPGASGRVQWRSARAYVPADLMVRREGGLGVFLANDGHARFVPLPGALEGQPAPAELPADARIIVEGRQGLQGGEAVSPATGGTAPE